MTSVSDIWKLVGIVGDADEGAPEQKLEDTPKGRAMQDVVSEVLARPDLKETNLANQKLSVAYFFVVTSILPEMSDSRRQSGGGYSIPEKTEKALAAPSPNAVYQATIAGDFYTRLGITKDATKTEIDQAYRNWAKENHPDVLRSKNADAASIAKAEKNAILMGEAYNTLKSPRLRPEYDKFWDLNFSSSGSKKSSSIKDSPQLTAGESSDFSYVVGNFKSNTTRKNESAQNKTAGFRKTVADSGNFVVDDGTVEFLNKRGLIPEGFNKNQITNAFQLYSRGATSDGLAIAVENSDFLSEGERTSLSNTAFFMKFYEEAGIESLPSQEDLFEANNQPTFSLSQQASPSPSSPANISFDRNSENILSPVLNKVTGMATDKVQDLAVDGLKAGAKKILKKGVEETAVKTGAKLAGNASLKAGIWAVMESIGIAGGPVGEAIATVIAFVIAELLPMIFNFVKKLFDPQTLAYVLMAIGAGMMALGAPMMGVASLGAGTFSFFKAKGGGKIVRGIGGTLSSFGIAIGTAIIVAIGWPLIFAVIGIPVIIVFVLFIITSGAYIVPPHLTNSMALFQNPYIEVRKTIKAKEASDCVSPDNTSTYLKCTNGNLPLTVVYTVTIAALRGPLTNVEISDNCRVQREATGPSECPPATNIQTSLTIQPTSFPFNASIEPISPSSPFVFTYERNFDPALTYYDSLSYDTITVNATSSDNTNESVSSSASMCIGNCPAGCFVISDARNAWPSQYKNNLQQSLNTLISQYPGFTRKACSDGNEIPICYGGSSPDGRWGDHFGHGTSCDISLYTNPDGTPNNYIDVLYVTTHELGHHITSVAPEFFAQYRSYPGIGSELPLCNNSVSTDSADVFGFCDSSALYISGLPMTRFRSCSSSQGLIGTYPSHASFVENVMLK